jgi:DNA-binding SARP family transcriptional activator
MVTTGLQFGVLGPLHMSIDVPFGAPKQRAMGP